MNDRIKIIGNKNGTYLLRAKDTACLVLESIPKAFTIQPDTSSYLDLISHSSNRERMLNAWVRTGNQMKSALSNYQVQNDKKKSKATAQR